jgi:hypothetical protein
MKNKNIKEKIGKNKNLGSIVKVWCAYEMNANIKFCIFQIYKNL